MSDDFRVIAVASTGVEVGCVGVCVCVCVGGGGGEWNVYFFAAFLGISFNLAECVSENWTLTMNTQSKYCTCDIWYVKFSV